MLTQLVTWLEQLVLQTGYLGIFLATMVESFFAPIPSEIILVTAGFTARGNGGFGVLLIMCVVGALGNYVGTLPFYAISYWGSETVLPKFLDRWGKYLLITRKDLAKGERLFAKYGSKIVFFARLIPGIRSLIAFPAGLARLNFLTYTSYTLLGSSLWNLFLGSIGFLAYDSKDQIIGFLTPIERFILLAIAIVVIAYIARVVYQMVQLSNDSK